MRILRSRIVGVFLLLQIGNFAKVLFRGIGRFGFVMENYHFIGLGLNNFILWQLFFGYTIYMYHSFR